MEKHRKSESPFGSTSPIKKPSLGNIGNPSTQSTLSVKSADLEGLESRLNRSRSRTEAETIDSATNKSFLSLKSADLEIVESRLSRSKTGPRLDKRLSSVRWKSEDLVSAETKGSGLRVEAQPKREVRSGNASPARSVESLGKLDRSKTEARKDVSRDRSDSFDGPRWSKLSRTKSKMNRRLEDTLRVEENLASKLSRFKSKSETRLKAEKRLESGVLTKGDPDRIPRNGKRPDNLTAVGDDGKAWTKLKPERDYLEYKFFRSFSAKLEYRWPIKKAEAIWRKLRDRKISG